MEHPGLRLKKLREERGITDEELVKKLYPEIKKQGVNLLIVRAWEAGLDVHLHDTLLIKLAKFFDVSISYLLGL